MQKIKGTKIQIPDLLKQDLPQTTFGKVLAATPVVMTVVATMLAGLASSEMNKAQYDRSLAAQQQSKAGDQWSFFQAKRLRGAIQRNSFDMLQMSGGAQDLDADSLRNAAEGLPQDVKQAEEAARERARLNGVGAKNAERYLQGSTGRAGEAEKLKEALLQVTGLGGSIQPIELISRGELPKLPAAPALDPKLKAAMQAVESSSPDAELFPLLGQVSNQELEQALKAAREQVQAMDNANRPVNQTLDSLEKLIGQRVSLLAGAAEPGMPGPGSMLLKQFTAARLRFAALRYEAEARLNQTIANLYELQVRKSNISAERHHRRSQRFFFGMLAAQAAVIIATFAMAARQRNLLWSLAAAAGLIAVIVSVYVYLWV